MPIIVLKSYQVRLIGQTPSFLVDKPGIIVFQQHWCGHCRANEAILQAVNQQRPDIPIYILDGVSEPIGMKRVSHLIEGYPTIYQLTKTKTLGRQFMMPRKPENYIQFYDAMS